MLLDERFPSRKTKKNPTLWACMADREIKKIPTIWVCVDGISEYFVDHCSKKKNENEKKIERKYFRLNLFKLSKGARWFFRSQIQFKFR